MSNLETTTTTAPGLYLLVGTGDPLAQRNRRDELVDATGVEPGNVERIDLAEEDPRGVILAATAPSLFGGTRVVVCENFDAFPADLAGELVRAVSGSDAVIIATADKQPAKAVLEAVTKVEKFTQPKGAAVAERIGELAASHGVQLTAAQRTRLAKSGVSNWDALNDALSKLGDLGGGPVSATDLAALEASVTGEPPPWDVSDAIEAGDISRALELMEARSISAYATFAYLANRVRDLGLVVEASTREGRQLRPEEIQRLCGINHPFPAKKLGEVARRADPTLVGRAWEILTEADLAMRRTSDASGVVKRVAVELADLWRRARTR